MAETNNLDMPEAFRGMGGSPDRVRPYTGPDLALRWQWRNSGATLVVEPAEELYYDASTDEVETYDERDDAEREYYQYEREYENEQYDQETYDERDDEDYEDYVCRAFDEREQDYCSDRMWNE